MSDSRISGAGMQEALKSDAGGDGRRERLIEIVTAKSLIRGREMKLVSGATSKHYFDMKPTIFDPEALNLIAELMLEAIGDAPVDLVGGLEMGAVPIAAAVCQKSFPDKPVRGFFVRKQPKDHGTRRLVEGLGDSDLTGLRAVIVEDVTTTGGSSMKAVKALRDEGVVVDTMLTIVDREEGAEANVAKEGLKLMPLLTASDFTL